MGSSEAGLERPGATSDEGSEDATERLRERFTGWCEEPFARHALAVSLLILVAAARWWRQVFDPLPQNDETVYFAAFEAARQGASPYSVSGYLTFSSLAYVGAWGLDLLGRVPTLALFRLANLLGLATAIWCSTAWLPWSWGWRLSAGLTFVVLAPAVGFGVELGNLSLLMAGVMIFALLFWPRAPMSSGALLGLSTAIKPVAPGAIVALLCHRPARGGRQHLLTGSVAAALTAAVVLASPHLEAVLGREIWFRLERTVSPYRFAHLLGLRGSEPAVLGLVVLTTILVARSRVLGPVQCYALAATAAIAATPVVWSHTLLLALPLQVLALLVLHHRRSRGRLDDSLPRRHVAWGEVALVVLAVVAIQGAEGATNIYDQHMLIQWLGTIPPAIAPAVLTFYLLRHTAPF